MTKAGPWHAAMEPEALHVALDAAEIGIWHVDLATQRATRDARMNEILGLPPEASVQPPADFFSRIHDEDRARATSAFERALAGADIYDNEVRIRRPSGELRWIRDRGRIVRDDAGAPRYAAGAVTDITHLKRAELAFGETEERFKTLADNMSQLAWMADEKGWIFWYNRRWYDYTGTTLEDMQGWGWRKVHHPDHVERVVERIQRSWTTGEPWEDTFPLRGHDGAYRWFLSRALPIRDARGDVVRWFGTNTDVTAQRAAEAALTESDRRKSEFIATLSHELRNPLAPIRTGLDILKTSADPARRERTQAMIDRQLVHLVRLLDDLLDVSRIAHGTIELRRQPVPVRPFVESAIEASGPVIAARQHTLIATFPEREVWVDGDAVRLTQVVTNLLTNAAKYTHPGGRIEVRVAAGDGEVVVQVVDSGMGIDAAQLPGVFEMFVQTSPTAGGLREGLGIGLSLVRSLVALHDGTVAADSAGLGQGSTFTVRLPTIAAPAPAPDARGAAADRSSRQRILLVDDNTDASELLAELLALHGHEVRTAASGREGLACARELRPDVIFLDIGMPGMTGFEVVGALRADAALASTTVVALTGWGSADEQRQTREAGFDFHLTKPIAFASVERLLARLASGQRSRDPGAASD